MTNNSKINPKIPAAASNSEPHSTSIQPASQSEKSKLSMDEEKILQAKHHDPFSILGKHSHKDSESVRVFLPNVREVFLSDIDAAMSRIQDTDLFFWQGEVGTLPDHYRLEWYDDHGKQHFHCDPYSFAPQMADFDLHLFGEGKHWHAYRMFGAHLKEIDEISGVLFSVWAPNAERVSVIGDFNNWDGRTHAMRSRGNSGIWEIFIPDLHEGNLYKFEIRTKHGQIFPKSDPYGQAFEYRPRTASVVVDKTPFLWQDQAWLEQRAADQWLHNPFSIYEVHLGSWQKDNEGNFLNYTAAAHRLVDYVKDLGFTHIELLPITEHPLDDSWGYQTTGYFAPTSRFGTPDEFRYFVNHCHRNNIGVIMDWAPAHFPKDSHALAQFDGSALYEHEDPRRAEHRDWGTLIYNYGRKEVMNFLLSSAIYWLEEFHIDGLRVDAVASMLYLDYSREEGDWLPNPHGGNENLEAIHFVRELNAVAHSQFPGSVVIAEESTAWPQVTRPIYVGGLGFSMKWNMGWMHDTLSYFNQDPVYRRYNHDQLTFGLMYAFTENFVLPFSHDEVVHGKGSMINKMPGDHWQKFANLRLLYTFMFSYPGKKLMFMGSEFAQFAEWNFNSSLDWHLLDLPEHSGVKQLVSDLNSLYKRSDALHHNDFDHSGFEWIDCHDADQSIISYTRKSDGDFLLILLNFTPIPRHNYRIGVPLPGSYKEILNSDSSFYNGSNVGNLGEINTEDQPWMGKLHSINVTLPPLAGVILAHHASNI